MPLYLPPWYDLVDIETFSRNINDKWLFITDCAICLIKYGKSSNFFVFFAGLIVKACHYTYNKVGPLERRIGILYKSGRDTETTWCVWNKFYCGLVIIKDLLSLYTEQQWTVLITAMLGNSPYLVWLAERNLVQIKKKTRNWVFCMLLHVPWRDWREWRLPA